MCCLFKTASNLTDRLNTLLEIYADFVPDWRDYVFNMDWSDTTEGFDNFEYYRKDIQMIPVQKGNEGSVEKPVAEKPVVATATVAPEKVSPLNLPPRPAPAPVRQQPYYAQQPVGYPPQYQDQVQAPPQGPVLAADGGIDFNSIIASNPAVAAAGAVGTVINAWGARQPQGYPPGYAPPPGYYPPPQDPRMFGYPPGYPPAGYYPPMQDPRLAGVYAQPPQYTGAPPGYNPGRGGVRNI